MVGVREAAQRPATAQRRQQGVTRTFCRLPAAPPRCPRAVPDAWQRRNLRLKIVCCGAMDWMLLVAVVAVAYLLLAVVRAAREALAPRPEPVKWSLGDVTDVTLATYNGMDWSKPVCVAVRGVVYDVSGASLYGPGAFPAVAARPPAHLSSHAARHRPRGVEAATPHAHAAADAVWLSCTNPPPPCLCRPGAVCLRGP